MISISSNIQTKKMVRVLVVEDEYILAINLQESLESLGYTVPDIVDSGEAAIEKATELRPNLILMDIRLRGEMDGIEAAEQIWNSLQIPIIYVTGHSDKSTVERATLTLPFGYILKPIREQELYVAIQTALSRYEREQFLSTVLREMGSGVIVVDPQLRVKYLNQVAEALTGWRLNEAKERKISEVIKLIDAQTKLTVKNPLISTLEEETTVCLSDRILLITKDGKTIPIADSATHLRDNSGLITGAVMVFREDTQRRLNEEPDFIAERNRLLEIQVAELERLNQLKEDFLTTTSHEMRTPLLNIKMAIYMLENALTQQGILTSEPVSASESVVHYLSILREQCEQQLNLVDNLLNMRMIDADVYPLELISIQLQDWLPHIAECFQERAQAQQQILQVSISPNLPPLISDLASLTQIVSELLNNACKYTLPDEQIRLTVKLVYTTINVINEDAQVPYFQITISNSGMTIPVKEQSRIFEPFYRIPQSDRHQHGGTGLGLALVKKLVECLEGTIEVTTSQGWTSFVVKLPVKIIRN